MLKDAVLPKHAIIKIPKVSTHTEFHRDTDDLGSLFPMDYKTLPLKDGHEERPLYVREDGRIYLETFSKLYLPAQDFLIAIAEPKSRPNFIHEYQMTPYSLYAGTSIGLETDKILSLLERLSKVPIPLGLASFIRSCTESYGKVKLVLLKNRYWAETVFPDILQLLLKEKEIQDCRKGLDVAEKVLDKAKSSIAIDDDDEIEEDADPTSKALTTYSFEIDPQYVEKVKRKCIELDFPMLEEYDFRGDTRTPRLSVDLRSTTQIRPYQETSLSKMFSHGRARSGIIVLPCGAGKTLVGITATCTIGKATLVLCTSAVAVEQWRQQFKLFTLLPDHKIARFTSDVKERFEGDSGILITTYTMVAYRGEKRSHEAAKMMEFIRRQEWGFLLLDEVHVVPAQVFRRVLTTVAAHSKLGLTATLVREDDKIADLHFLIGPKLYEANWLDLAKQGHIASVSCFEVRCPVAPCFYREYLSPATPMKRKRLLSILNPYKFQICQALIAMHEARGDKIIVFSDNVYALKAYALRLKKPFIYGPTPQLERLRILHQFQNNPNLNTVFLSKVGDTSIDLPEATCLIQISSHYGSRRQEAQRLGRILRAKRRSEEGFQAYFYSLVSMDTHEIFYSAKRQPFLIDQGYAFRVMVPEQSALLIKSLGDNAAYLAEKEQLALLRSILVATESEVTEEDVDSLDDFSATTTSNRTTSSTSKGLGALSGANDLAYMETNRPVSSSSINQQQRQVHPLFKARFKK